MVVRVNLKTGEQTVLEQYPHPNDISLDKFANLLAKYSMAVRKTGKEEKPDAAATT